MKLSYGSFNTSSYNLLYGSGKDKFGYLFNAEKGYSEGDRQNSWKDFFNLSGKVTYSSFIFSGGYSQDKKETPGSTNWPTPKATQEDEKSWFDLAYKWEWKKSYLSLKGFLNQNRTIYENPDWAQKDTIVNKTYGANLQHTTSFSSKNNFIWGIDWRQNEVDVKTIKGTSRIGGKRRINLGALYLQDEIKTFPNLILTLGTRYDNHSVYGSEISPRISFLYHLGELTSLRGSWGKAFRSPTVNDLYWQEDWGGRNGIFWKP